MAPTKSALPDLAKSKTWSEPCSNLSDLVVIALKMERFSMATCVMKSPVRQSRAPVRHLDWKGLASRYREYLSMRRVRNIIKGEWDVLG